MTDGSILPRRWHCWRARALLEGSERAILCAMSTMPSSPAIAPAEPAEHRQDFYTWALEQAALIRAGQLNAIDRENVAEEIESLGNEQFAKLRSAYRVLLLHMLKWEYQPERRSRSWLSSMLEHRARIGDLLEDSPGLRPRVSEAIEKGYDVARRRAAVETGLPISAFSDVCPWPGEVILNRQFDIPEHD